MARRSIGGRDYLRHNRGLLQRLRSPAAKILRVDHGRGRKEGRGRVPEGNTGEVRAQSCGLIEYLALTVIGK